jgi:predicted O-methyltransferase YrrM
MPVKQTIKKAIADLVRTVLEIAKRDTKDARNVELALTAMLSRGAEHPPTNDMTAYVDLLRTCIMPLSQDVVTIKNANQPEDTASRRFSTLLDMLRSQIQPIPSATAIDIATLADRFRGLRTPLDFQNWSSDDGLLFEISSSFGVKGRILASIIRIRRPLRCLELGTAFGMSAIFMMESFKHVGIPGHLVTIEGDAHLYSVASPELKSRYGDAIDCEHGMTGDVLPKLARSPAPFDFLFHDAAHTGDAYVSDFNAIVDALAPGAVILFDDIRWEDQRFRSRPAKTYDGWQKVVAHPRVRHAVEIEKSMGLALLT